MVWTEARFSSQLTFLDASDERLTVSFAEFAEGKAFQRSVPVRYVETTEGRVAVATVYDLLMAQYGVGRGLEGDYPADYDDEIFRTPPPGRSVTPALTARR